MKVTQMGILLKIVLAQFHEQEHPRVERLKWRMAM